MAQKRDHRANTPREQRDSWNNPGWYGVCICEATQVPLHIHDSAPHLGLLVCDDCDRVRQADGSLSTWKRSEATLVQQLPHFMERDAFARPAIAEGWRAESPSGVQRVRWSCPECAQRVA